MTSPESYNLNKPKNKKEQRLENLYGAQKQIAQETNKEVGFDLVDEEGKINPEGFGGLTEKEEEYIKNREESFSKINDPSALASFRKAHQLENLSEDEMKDWLFKHWQESKAFDKNAMLEVLTTIIFHKALGKDYLVVRSSTYDDYKNGVDLLIVNKKTGEVIGAFDEVHDRKFGDRTAEKNQKIIKQAKNGGVRVEHGVGIEKGEITKKRLFNVPNFYLLLTIDELEDALDEIDYKNLDTLSDKENTLYIKFASAIMQQAEMLLAQEGTAPVLKTKLEKVKEFFKK